ncbi:MAG: ParA family protein, partial [Deltaproteobacteria bacterium]|nr:ParA family protein [Deltaproteobacteria bacterium]
DRVLIPVKDMPSLENCKNIFALFDQRGIDKKSLALLPCLIDSRIKFEGIFKDQKTLLRAFAVNRGYRCLDSYISKSPKVESLNTNPDGKIYPILTHARGTEVHSQFMEITRDILRSVDTTEETRSCLYHKWLLEKESRKKESYLARLEGLAERCHICGSLLSEKPEGRSFYYETSDRAARGFLHGDCVSDMLCSTLYGLTSRSDAYTAARMAVANNAGRVVSLLAPRLEGSENRLDYRQFSMGGEQLLRKDIEMPGFDSGEFDGVHDRLYLLLNEALSGFEGKLRQGGWLSVYPVDPANPEAVLHEDYYKIIQKVQQSISRDLEIT